MLNRTRILIILAVIIIIGIFIFIFNIGKNPPKGSIISLQFWGPKDLGDDYAALIAKFQGENRNVKIIYTPQNPKSYELDMINALAAGKGPDIVLIHRTWLAKHTNKLFPAPKELISAQNFSNNYADLVIQDLVSENYVWAIPLYLDTLALYFNRDIFNSAGIVFPPKTWEELNDIIPQLAKIEKNGSITQPAIALGASKNINHISDILSLLFLQNNVALPKNKTVELNLSNDNAVQAIQFYLQFSDSKSKFYTWNNNLKPSLDLFSEGKMAMYIGYAGDYKIIKQKAPFLRFEISPFPQPAQTQLQQNYGDYWALSVTKKSGAKKYELAWKFIKFLSETENNKSYLIKNNLPPASRNLIAYFASDPFLGTFAKQSLTAKNWYQVDSSYIESVFGAMVESIIQGEKIDSALEKAQGQIKIKLKEGL